MADELTFIIRARNAAERAIKSLTRDLNDLERKTEQVEKTAQRTSNTFDSRMTAAVKGLAGSFVALQAARRVIELTELGAAAEKAETRFIAYSGGVQQAAANLDAMTEASDRALSKMEAQRAASRLLSLGLAKNSEDMERLTRIAVLLGDETLSATERIDQFGLLLANQSIQRLDTFGFSVGAVRKRIEELQAADKNLARDQAFLIAVMEEGERKVKQLEQAGFEATTGMERLRAAISDVAVATGREFVPYVDRAAGALADWIRTTQEASDVARQNAVANNATYEEYQKNTRGLGAMSEAEFYAAKAQQQLTTTLDDGTTVVQDYEGWIIAAKEGTEQAGDASAAAAGDVDKLTDSFIRLGDAAGNTRLVTISALQDLASSDALDRFVTIEKQESDLRDQRVAEEKRAADEIASARESSAKRATAAVERAWEQARNTIRSAVEGALADDTRVTSEDFLLERFGLRKESVFESVRQLNDIIQRALNPEQFNFEQSPFVQYFTELQGLAGDELAANAVVLRDRILGFLEPDFLNLDSALEKARNAIIGQRNKESIINDLTNQLIGEGFGADEVERALSDQFGNSADQAINAFQSSLTRNAPALAQATTQTFVPAFDDAMQKVTDLSLSIDPQLTTAVNTFRVNELNGIIDEFADWNDKMENSLELIEKLDEKLSTFSGLPSDSAAQTPAESGPQSNGLSEALTNAAIVTPGAFQTAQRTTQTQRAGGVAGAPSGEKIVLNIYPQSQMDVPLMTRQALREIREHRR